MYHDAEKSSDYGWRSQLGFYINFDEMKLRTHFGTAVEVSDLLEMMDTRR